MTWSDPRVKRGHLTGQKHPKGLPFTELVIPWRRLANRIGYAAQRRDLHAPVADSQITGPDSTPETVRADTPARCCVGYR